MGDFLRCRKTVNLIGKRDDTAFKLKCEHNIFICNHVIWYIRIVFHYGAGQFFNGSLRFVKMSHYANPPRYHIYENAGLPGVPDNPALFLQNQ